MPALFSFLMPLIPYFIGAIAVVAAYFGIKQKGVQQERQRQEVAQQKAQQQIQQKIEAAKSKDTEIDNKAQAAKDKVDEANKPVDNSIAPGSEFKF